jgi:hypothetical protein
LADGKLTPPSNCATKGERHGLRSIGSFGLLLLVANVYAIVKTVQSNATTGTKVAWVVAILIFPLLGFAIWFFFGPRG